MADVNVGQVWEVYSHNENRWVPVIVAKIEDDTVIFRYQGSLELLRVNVSELESEPERFRLLENDQQDMKT